MLTKTNIYLLLTSGIVLWHAMSQLKAWSHLILKWALLSGHYSNLQFIEGIKHTHTHTHTHTRLKNTLWKADRTRPMFQEMERIQAQNHSWTVTLLPSPDSGWFPSTEIPWNGASALTLYSLWMGTRPLSPHYPFGAWIPILILQCSFQKGNGRAAEERGRRDEVRFS